MKRITIERYNPVPDDVPLPEGGPIPVNAAYAGLIEGEADNGDRWVMFLDRNGRPEVFWPKREEDGAVIGDGIKLDRVPGQFSGVFSMLGVQDDADSWDENGPRNPGVVSCFPVWHPGKDIPTDKGGVYPPDTMRGVVFAVVPGEGLSVRDRMRKFLDATSEGFKEEQSVEGESNP